MARRKSDRESKAELQALAEAREALSAGRFLDVANAYARAGRASQRSGRSGIPHFLKALEFWSAGDQPKRGITLGNALLAQTRGSSLERTQLRIRLAQLHQEIGHHRKSIDEFNKVWNQKGRLTPLDVIAGIGLLESHLFLGQSEELPPLLRRLSRASERLGDRRLEAAVLRIRSRYHEWLGDWSAALVHYESLIALAEKRGLRHLAFIGYSGAARTCLRMRLLNEAREAASQAHEISRRLPESRIQGDSALLFATVLVAQALTLEQDKGPGIAVGMRREARRHLAMARRQYKQDGNAFCLGESWLEEARLALHSSPRLAIRAAREAGVLFKKSGNGPPALLARAIEFTARTGTQSHEWRRLARQAEKEMIGEVAGLAWLGVARTTNAGLKAQLDALENGYGSAHLEQPGSARLATHGLTGDAPTEAANQIAQLRYAEEPEPKMESIRWVLRARTRKCDGPGAQAPPANKGAAAQILSRLSLLLAGQHATARRSGKWPNGAAERKDLIVARTDWVKATTTARKLESTDDLSRLQSGEALVLFAILNSRVQTWVIRPDGITAHFEGLTIEEWRETAQALDQQFVEARGWPDAIAPENVNLSARDELTQVATAVWTPLLPSISGVADVLIAPDPNLEILPFASLSLAALPTSLPRPRSISLLSNVSRKRTPRWRQPESRVLSLVYRNPERALQEREAKSVVRILGGEFLSSSQLHAEEDERKSLADRLKTTRLWHVAAPFYPHSEQPLISLIDLGADPIDLGWLARQNLKLDLMVIAEFFRDPPEPPELGRVVGTVGPEGARPIPQNPVELRRVESIVPLMDMLGRSGIKRVIVNRFPSEMSGPSAVSGGLYAGIAREDSPTRALYLAQRNAWTEGLHPVQWAGYSCWGWP